MCYPGDFPSATRLRDAGVRHVVLVQSGSPAPRTDLARTLAAWQRDQLRLHLVRADDPDVPRPLSVRGPGLGAAIGLWLRRLRLAGNARDGFGAHMTAAGPHAG